MKWTSILAVFLGIFSKGPALVVALVVSAIVILVLATYLLVARGGVTPRIRWKGFSLDFIRLPKE